jgi:hypothetical protein
MEPARGLVVILEFLWIEMARLGVDDMAGELDHFGRQFEFRDVLEVGALISNLVGIAQGRRKQARRRDRLRCRATFPGE